MIELLDEKEVVNHLKTNNDVVALFFASWCPFCRRFLKVYNEYAEKPGNQNYVRIRIDEDENPMWETYSIEAVPTVILFKNGQISSRLDCEHGIGLTEEKFVKWLNQKK